MVAKISKGSDVYGVFAYNQNKVDKGEATVLSSSRFIHNNGCYNVEDCVRSIDHWLTVNNRTEKPMVHISLNPDPRDVVEDEDAIDIAEEYLKKMGYEDQPYILYKHEDISRTHYHIVTICVDIDGKKINSDYEKRRSMKVCREIETEYDLHIPSKKELKNIEEPQRVIYKNGDIKNQITRTVNSIVLGYNIRNLSEFRTVLELYNTTVTEVNGKVEDKLIEGLFYSATDDDGKKVGRQLKSSLFGKSFGRKSLEEKFSRDKKQKLSERDKTFLKRVLVQCMYQCKYRTREELVALLKKRGVDLVLRDTKDGSRLFGVTIVDHNTKQVLKGSEVNPAFSANILTQFFDNPNYVIPFPLENKGLNTEEPTKKEEDAFKKLEDAVSNGGWFVGGGDVDAEEEAYKRMQKKRKFMKRGKKMM